VAVRPNTRFGVLLKASRVAAGVNQAPRHETVALPAAAPGLRRLRGEVVDLLWPDSGPWEVDLCWCAVGSSFPALLSLLLARVLTSSLSPKGPGRQGHCLYTSRTVGLMWAVLAGVGGRGDRRRGGTVPPGRNGKEAA
jgi:hypothetical protein